MVGTSQVFMKEMSDHLSSKRFYIIFFIIYLLSFSIAREAIQGIASETQRTGGGNVFLKLFTTYADVIPPFISIIAFFGPIIGFVLSFDAINHEFSTGTIGNILSQPVHRDSVINGKFAAGAATVAIIIASVTSIVLGLGIFTLGAIPSMDEMLRISAFTAINIVYLSMWVALGLLYSVYFKREGTSALASIATWLFFTLFIYMIAGAAGAMGVSPLTIQRLSPSFLYVEAASVIMIPKLRILSPVSLEKIIGMIPTPLPFEQSLLLVWPHITSLTALMIIIFAASYTGFMKQEIRST